MTNDDDDDDAVVVATETDGKPSRIARTAD